MPPKPSNNLSRPAKATVASFKTSKGSEYTVDGVSTTRNKALHAEHGPTDVGIKPKSSRTVYIGSDAQSDVAYAVGQLDRGASVKMEGDELVVRYNYGRADKPRQMEKRFPVAHTPEKGMAPVEFWSDKNSVHVGNEITEITHAPLTGPNSMPSKNSKRNLSPLARTGQQMTTDMMPGEGGFVESGSPTLQRSAASPITPAEKQSLLDTILRSRSRKKKAEAASRLKEIIKLEAEGLEPQFAQSGQNLLPSEREMLTGADSRAMERTLSRGPQLRDRMNAEKAVRGAATRGTLESETARLLDSTVRSPAKGAVAAEAEAAAQFAKTGPLGRAAGAVGGAASAVTSKLPWLTKIGGALGWTALAMALYENTIGRRNDGRAEEATGLMDAGLQGLDRAPMAGEEAYGRLLPDIARESEAAGYAQDRSETSNLLSLDSLLTQNQQALRSSAQVTPISVEEYMLRVKAELAARGA